MSGAQGCHDIQRKLRDLLPGYDKHLDFSLLQAGYTNAVARARRLDEDAEKVERLMGIRVQGFTG